VLIGNIRHWDTPASLAHTHPALSVSPQAPNTTTHLAPLPFLNPPPLPSLSLSLPRATNPRNNSWQILNLLLLSHRNAQRSLLLERAHPARCPIANQSPAHRVTYRIPSLERPSILHIVQPLPSPPSAHARLEKRDRSPLFSHLYGLVRMPLSCLNPSWNKGGIRRT
jgi:hypothetical protein